jgi:flagellar biosynthesis/type III secretory pathway chaperone
MNPELAAAAANLADILAQENAALAALDLCGAGALLIRKLSTVDAFAQAHKKAAPSRPRDLDRATVSRLRSLADENKRLLTQAMAVQSRVIELVARAVPKSPRYNATGAHAAGTRMPPMTLSKRI